MSSLEHAVHRAAAAAPDWAALPAAQRASALREAAVAVGAAADELGRAVTAETGKRYGDARGSALVARDTINQYAELGPLHRGRSLQGDPLAVDTMVPVPFGTVAVITPWNDPLAVAAQGIAAALAVGNTVVCKPSERATQCTARLVEVIAAALPDGVLTVVEGAGEVGAALVARPEIAAVVFTGSTAVGRAIGAECGRRLKKAVLELGGKDALIVDDGVDPAWAAREAATAAFANAGQICVSAERLVVHRAVADEFAAELAPPRSCASVTRSTKRPTWARWSTAATSTSCTPTSPMRWTVAPRCSWGANHSTPTAGSTLPPCSPASRPTASCGGTRRSGRSPRSAWSTPSTRLSPSPRTPTTAWPLSC
jgi:succinate-semialdehyde dehydrogenase/glutarate-semialdehyde dehydrogenase